MAGTAITVNLVNRSGPVRDKDKAVLDSIKASIWERIEKEKASEDLRLWAAATILAAYNLGKEDLNLHKILPKK